MYDVITLVGLLPTHLVIRSVDVCPELVLFVISGWDDDLLFAHLSIVLFGLSCLVIRLYSHLSCQRYIFALMALRQLRHLIIVCLLRSLRMALSCLCAENMLLRSFWNSSGKLK